MFVYGGNCNPVTGRKRSTHRFDTKFIYLRVLTIDGLEVGLGVGSGVRIMRSLRWWSPSAGCQTFLIGLAEG